MLKKLKTYYIAGMFWQQSELNFTENEQVRAILKKARFSMKEFTTEKLGEIIEKLYEGGVLKELMPIILKRDDSGLKRLLNWAAYNVKQLDNTNIINEMTDSDIAEVMLDFFILKTRWIQNLLGITTRSKWSLASILNLKKLRALKKQSTSSVTAITQSVN